MNLFGQFLLYNLLPSILIGLFAWLIVVIALKYLPIREARLRLSFLGVPVIKSALVLLGVAPMLPWPHSLFARLQANALSPEQLLPVLLVWTAVLLLAYFWLVGQVRRNFLQAAYKDKRTASRLEQSLSRVRHRYQQNPVPRCDVAFCTFATQAPKRSNGVGFPDEPVGEQLFS